MKIIQIIPQFDLAGAEIMCERLTYALGGLGHKVIVISLYDVQTAITDRISKAGVDIRYLGKKSGLDLSVVTKLKRIFCEERPDVVHTHLYVAKYAIPAAIFAGVKVRVHTVHNVAQMENGTIDRKINSFFFKCCGVIPVALSDKIQQTIADEYGMKEERIPVVANGIDLSLCLPKEKYDIEGTFKILHIGRFMEQKNQLGLLEGFLLFYKKYPNTVLQLIGDGEKRAEIETFIKKNALESVVQLLGIQKNVYPFLQDADVFVLPSLYEGNPMTLIEAMGTGLPIVATDVGGVADMLEDHKSALLIKAEPSEIADAFMALAENESLRQKLGSSAKEAAVRYSAESMAKGYCEIYDKSTNR